MTLNEIWFVVFAICTYVWTFIAGYELEKNINSGEKTMRELRATFDIHRNDMRWKCHTYIETEASPFEWFKLEWQGYNDDNWWDNVAPTACVKSFVGDQGTTKTFRIDYHTMLIVEVTEGKM